MNRNRVHMGQRIFKGGILRLGFVAISFFAETLFIALMFTRLASYIKIMNGIIRWTGIILVLAIYAKNTTASMRLPWIILILSFPIFGTAIYVIIGLNGSPKRMRKSFEAVNQAVISYVFQEEDVLSSMKELHPDAFGISSYIYSYAKYPVYLSEEVNYFTKPVEVIPMLLRDLKEAKKYIFLEYFAVDNHSVWKFLERVLVQKVKEGVEIRVLYDDVGSIGYVNLDFAKHLRSLGIQCIPFNPCSAGLKLILNHRDHRKMTIIDGKVAYTGGYNIADEYFEISRPFGSWKDTGIRVQGQAVNSFVICFLEMWLFNSRKKGLLDEKKEIWQYLIYDQTVTCRKDTKEEGPEEQKYARGKKQVEKGKIKRETVLESCSQGFLQPYADNPLDHENVGEEIYISILNKAKEYCYFMTPYLIITDEMQHAMILAAKRGVDVRIITPGVPDKKIIYRLTRSYYQGLMKGGVKIFEWTPGFCHAKMCLADGIMGTCGTVNLDYRSLYHHFENGCFMVGGEVLKDIKMDFDDTFAESVEVTEDYKTRISAGLRLEQLFLRLFAELM